VKNNNLSRNTVFSIIAVSALFLLPSNFVYAQDPAADALPQGATTVNGTTNITSSGNNMNVTASDKAIVSWNSFNIGQASTVNFVQPSSSATVLNRVVGVDPSSIYGTLNANGRVVLVNPNGILFGAGSQVNVNALMASTLDISNSDFIAGKYNFFQNGKPGWIINQGHIHISNGGYVVLLSNAIANSGVIEAPLGHVVLASGQTATVMGLDDNSDISVVINDAVANGVFGPDGQKMGSAIKNSGTIQADGGKVILTAKVLNSVFDYAVNNSGVIQANSLQNNNGVVEITASGAPVINTGTIAATQVNISNTDSNFTNTGEIKANQINISVPNSTFINQGQGQVISQYTAGLLNSGNISLQALNLQQDGLISADNIIDLTADNVDTTVPFQNTTPSPVIKANQVNITANNLGGVGLPIAIDASNIKFSRTSGNIDLAGSQPIGSSVMITGPPAGFGGILYNSDANLTLDASTGSISVAPQAQISANNLTLRADNSIVNDGSIIAG